MRRAFRAIRRDIQPESRLGLGEQLAQVVLGSGQIGTFQSIAAFASFDDEVPTNRLLEILNEAGKQVLLPRVHPTENVMEFCEFSDLSSLGRDRFGILSPDGDPFGETIDVVLMPGLAFGRDGSRLGQGLGFYDRYLTECVSAPKRRWGVGYDEQVVASVPMEPHDELITHIITPTRFLACRPQ